MKCRKGNKASRKKKLLLYFMYSEHYVHNVSLVIKVTPLGCKKDTLEI